MNLQLIQTLVKNQLSAQQKAELDKDRRTQADLDLLLQIIETCQARIGSRSVKTAQPMTPDAAENLVIRVLSFNINKKDAAAFLAQLFNPAFIPILKSSLAAAVTEWDKMPAALAELDMLSEDEIYAAVVSRRTSRRRVLDWLKWPLPFMRTEATASRKFGGQLVFGALTAATVLAIFFLRPLTQPGRTIYAKYFDDTTNPRHLELVAELNGQRSKTGAEMDALTKSYANALSRYLAADFRDAIVVCRQIETNIARLDDSDANTALKNEFYFHYGLAHFYLAGSKWFNKTHLKKAIQYLSLLELQDNLSQIPNDEIKFYLALAFEMLGDEHSAKAYISRIPAASPYQEDSKQLLN